MQLGISLESYLLAEFLDLWIEPFAYVWQSQKQSLRRDGLEIGAQVDSTGGEQGFMVRGVGYQGW
jgi:hypothetical protein